MNEWTHFYHPPFLCSILSGTMCLSPEKAMAPHSSTLAQKIPWTEEPGGLQSMGSRRVGDDWATSLSLFTFLHWRRKWQPTPVFLPGESQGRWSLVGCFYGVAQSQTRLKRLSSSSSHPIKWEKVCYLNKVNNQYQKFLSVGSIWWFKW